MTSITPQPHVDDGLAPVLVSIVIPCYKQAHFLGDAIESALAQTYPALDIIVVNDGSPDDTSAVAARYGGVRCVEQPNGGLSAARNLGLSVSRGEYIVFLDADDRLLPNAVRTNAAYLSANPALGFVAGRSYHVQSDGTPLVPPAPQAPHPEGDLHVALLRRNRIRMPAMVMFRRRVFEAVGGFDPSVDACADYDMYLRVSRIAPVVFHDEIVAEYRRHGYNMSLDDALMLRQVCRVMRRHRRTLRSKAERDAWREGSRHAREFYGDRVASRIRALVRRGSGWSEVLADAAALLLHHPRGFLTHAVRKAVNTTRATRPEDADLVAP